MYLSQIALRDWKAFAAANFDLPQPGCGRNIVLIGAQNGFGKTSLFEAVVLGLFGREGLPLVARSSLAGYSQDSLRDSASYPEFLERALHRGAIERGRTSCSVKLVFVDDDEEPLEIQRIWHFNESGKFRLHDEQVHIYNGITRKAVGPPNEPGESRADWYREYVAQKLIPFTLAHFFMFDGEQVSVLAEREMSSQVRSGIEGLLGIPVLRQLANDLRKYATDKRKETANVSDSMVEKLEIEREELSNALATKETKARELEPELSRMKESRENLVRELSSFGPATQALMQEKFEDVKRLETEIDQGRQDLERLLLEDVAVALTGDRLRSKLKLTLRGEASLTEWNSGRKQGDANLERFIDGFNGRLLEDLPELTDSQRTKICEQVRAAWINLWHPPPDDCAEEIRHKFLGGPERESVISRLDEVSDLAAGEIMECLSKIDEWEGNLIKIRKEITQTEGVAPQADKMRGQLITLNERIEALNLEKGTILREITGIESQLQQRNTDLARLASKIDSSEPSSRRSKRAQKVALMVDDIVKDAVPSQIQAIADAMTAAHKSMAHKKDQVSKICIDQDCNVMLLDQGGTDLRGYDLSAGEKQIFTQSLISAVSSVSGWGFPMLVDTPLGRLDVEHRKGVLRHLVRQEQQVILLSTNTEIVGQYLEEIEPHVQKKFIIDHKRIGDMGLSNARVGYFDEEE